MSQQTYSSNWILMARNICLRTRYEFTHCMHIRYESGKAKRYLGELNACHDLPMSLCLKEAANHRPKADAEEENKEKEDEEFVFTTRKYRLLYEK
mmetsp:Transcript_9318/g.15073  ORF Transcript_9318/g.15073 Transcript_9318/m.15073 type:complete len:95 (-) Transcript_9318:6-290(-)